MPLQSSGIIVVEKPSSASFARVNNCTTTINTLNSSIRPPLEQSDQQNQIQYYEYYDVNENHLSQSQQYHFQQTQQHSTIVVDSTHFHQQQQQQQQQQQLQLGGSSVIAIGRKIHNLSSTPSSSSSSTSILSSSSSLPSSSLSNKPNLHIQTIKTVPMPQNKQYSQQQQIIQHTSHSTNVTTSNPQHTIHQQSQHVQQINLAASSMHHQTQHYQHTQQQPTKTTHMIQVSEEFLEQATNNHNTNNMMISTTGDVINQQQIFKIVSTDGTTGNMIIDATNQNANSTTTTSKVLLSNLTVLSKQQATGQGQIIGNNHQQRQNTGQTINFVNAKNLYTTSTTGSNITGGGGKQQKFTVATSNVGNYKGSSIKQTSTVNTQYLQQTNTIGQQKLNMTAGNRSMQMLTSTRVQNNSVNSNTTPNVSSSNNNVSLMSSNAAPAQTMVLQQPQKFIANNTAASKVTTATLGGVGGNVIKKSSSAGTLRMNNSHNTSAATKLMNNMQTTQGVKTFITQTPCIQQQQTQQNMNQLTMQHHTTKGGSKSKFVKQYNNAILNSAGAVAIATLPHQQLNSQNSMQIQQQQQQPHQQLQPQTTYINHHKSGGSGSTKINKINSKYAQSVAQLPPGTQLHQKSINPAQQQQQQHQQQQNQFQNATSNSNIKFVNAQGTVIQQQHQSLIHQKINNKHHQQQNQNFDAVDGNHIFNQTNANQAVTAGVTSCISSGITTLSSATAANSSLLTDDIMMVNGTQMTDELSARILQSMSQKSFGNQRYQQQQHVFQTKTSLTATPASTSNSSNSSCNSNSNNNMLPPPLGSTTQNTIIQTNNNSNILLSPREYTLYPTSASVSTVGIVATNHQSQQQQQHHHHQQQHSSSIHYNNLATPTSLNITAGSFSSTNNYITVSNNSNNMTTITPHTSSTSTANSACSGSTNAVRQAQSAPGSRSQSMERKLHESSMTRKSTEYYKVNNHNSLRGSSHHNLATATAAQTSGSLVVTSGGNMSVSVSNSMGVMPTSTSSSSSSSSMPRPPTLPPAALIMEPQAQVIHLQATKTLPGANNSSNDDDDIIGEEIRPVPVETDDVRLRILHAVLFDHTYVNPMPLVLPTTFAVQLPSSTTSSSVALTSVAPSGINSATGHGQQWSLGGIGAITSAGSGVAAPNYALYGSHVSRLNHDDDSYLALSNSSRLVVGDIDPGEETETAPEAELEDDSVTRCICDLTHDDGYMICCDKCCAWQHVDCMGIDRQNIPDEYLCELCQPRVVDKARARSLQLMKRKEQQQQLMLTAQAQTATSAGTIGAAGSAIGVGMGGASNLLPNDVLGGQQRSVSSGNGFSLTGNMTTDSAALQLLPSGGSNLKKSKILKKVKEGVSGKRSKKAEKLAAAAAAAAGLATSGKPARKETKKNTKRKKSGAHDGGNSTVGMTAAEKYAANLRQWIENYELAVTNHYSPELRARLHAISKQPSLLQCILNTENPILKEFSNGSLENRATTVPHAGGKILISNLDIVPNSPICELRGKYMLTTQYKTQNTSVNMNSPPPNNYHLASYKAHKTPGPFIFFYQLPGTDLVASSQLMPQTTTTTMLNPDGTYTTTTTTLPAQQSPPTFLRGPEICVDTRTYGNEARFVRRSCRPNAEIQHLFEKGTIHLFIVALTDIRASTEITIRHEPHDLLAVENKKSSSIIIQPTSTPCGCGLAKDCLFGTPILQMPPAAKSNAGRKSLAHSGGGSGNSGNLTVKQRKVNQQNLNRNRSISSSASGDSNMGVTLMANTVTVNPSSPNNISKMPVANKIVNNNALMPLTASCNSNLSNASSTLSTLTSITHDSGVCTSSSSPSISIPSPTQHMHSPIQQQIHQQHLQQQLMHNTQMKSTVQLLPQQQQQQVMQSLPTPLVLTSPNMSLQHQSVLQQPAIIVQQQQSISVITQGATTPHTVQEVIDEAEQQQPQTSLCLSTQSATEQSSPAQTQMNPIHQLMLQEQKEQLQPIQRPSSASTGILETVSKEATIAAVALQSLNTSHSPNASLSATSAACGSVDTHLQSTQMQQQKFVVVSATEATADQQQQQQQTTQKNNQNSEMGAASSNSSNAVTLSPQEPQQQSQLQQYKSPQKINHSQHNNTHPGRKTPGKHCRTTSFSEDNEQHNHNDDNSLTLTPLSSTPKEKPKLSREDRKMEAILKAIEKMERNQQRKQEQKQSKRQNAGSLNTTPTSPNKALDSGENSGGTKRINSHTGTAGRSRKKRKAGAKGGQSSGYNNQRKRRRSRMNSQESAEECHHNDHDPVTSESDGCAAMHSPPIQTVASMSQSHFSTPTSPSAMAGGITTTARSPVEPTNNVDQAAGLLMAFANPNITPAVNSSTETAEDHSQQSPHPSSSQYMISRETEASPPPTPPSQVSSACLLIEAAVGPLESNLDTNNEEIHSAEFKYPLQAKTKKHLMNNWLHQAEDSSTENNVIPLPEQNSKSLQSPVTSEVCSGAGGVSVISGGLDSLLQAAMSDLKQSQSDSDEPQNLSIAAQKVEQFIHQTESSTCGPPPQSQTEHKHSYEYKQQQRSFDSLPTPAVDLTLKTPLTIGLSSSSELNSNNRNFNLPLQVSTCSNNSSVKKRWLRQAISEETHEDFQHALSMTPSPTTAFSNSQTQPTSTCSTGSITNYVPNGFTTPLKKRRLLLTGTDEGDENLSQSCGDLCASIISSPPHLQYQQEVQMQFNMFRQNQSHSQEFENKEMAEDLSFRDVHEDVDVDVEKCDINETKIHHIEDKDHKAQIQELQCSKVEMEHKANVDNPASLNEPAPRLQDQTNCVIKHENYLTYPEIKRESLETSVKETSQSDIAEFNEQEDDVDILRSPSPGREMIKAEDNLVKIEPEDTSGMDDVKIDVEREESMAADDDVTQNADNKEELLPSQHKGGDENDAQTFSENVEIKKETKVAFAKIDGKEEEEEEDTIQKENFIRHNEVVKPEAEEQKVLDIKTKDESHSDIEEPKPKRPKFDTSEVTKDTLVSIKIAHELFMPEQVQTSAETKKTEKLGTLPHSSKDDEKDLKAEFASIEKQPLISGTAEIPSSASTLLAVRSSATDTFADGDAATPPPPIPKTTIMGGTAAPIQRHKSLSDDDIQARLHSFHKENILFLQSRNKKTKSSSSLILNSNSNSLSSSCLANSNVHHKNRTPSSSSTSTSNHQHHHNYHHHHHHHEGKEKSDKSSLKHHKTSSATVSGTAKKQKLHKRERTTSSSSGSNSHKNCTNLQLPVTSSSSLVNKNAIVNTSSSGSSKKVKSLKKSSSGSSTSSTTSLSLSTLATASTTSLNLEKEKGADKEKHHRQRSTSTSSSNCNSSVISTTPYPSSKKRQLNFELELTKDMHLLNSVSGGGKHKKETSRLLSDEQGHVATKKSKKETTLSQKEELKNGTNKTVKIEKEQDKKLSSSTTTGSTSTKQSAVLNTSTNTQTIVTPAMNTITVSTPTEDPKFIPTIVSQQSQPALTPIPVLKEHPTLPHFNNVVVATSSSLVSQQQQPSQPPLISAQSQPPVLTQNIPNRGNSPSFLPPVHNNHNQQLQQPSLPPTPPLADGMSSPILTSTVNSTSQLPFYNTIYGKLLDNTTTPPSLTSPLIPSNITTPPPPITSASVTTGGSVLSEYLDTKLKSYSTLGGYVSHTALFGLNNAAVVKDPQSLPSLISSATITHVKDSSIEMPAPLSTASGSSTVSLCSGNSSATITPLKIHTKTASHDPRLNPQLTAPEPPPQPKRKLSINEYRKRMQQSSSHDSNSGSGSLTTTPTTPPTSLDTSLSLSLSGPMSMPITNRCTLNSPDRLTQSVDSQIQKELMSTNSIVSSSSSLDSLNSSNSSTSLNDTLLKSSSFAEEDSTKGQFNAAPTLLEKQQESLCARLKSLKEKQSLGPSFNVGTGHRSRFSSFSESVASSDFGLRKGDDDLNITRNRNQSISSSIGGGDLLDNCLEEISSTSTSMSSSREPSPERYTSHHKILSTSATTTMTNTLATGHGNNGQTTQTTKHHQQHNINCNKSEIEPKKSIDIV